MKLFKKLQEEVEKVEFKKEVTTSLTESEKKKIGLEIIFGNILEDLEVDLIEEQYQKKEG